jgi:hypothetical protein
LRTFSSSTLLKAFTVALAHRTTVRYASAMRAEAQSMVKEIEESLELLRRRL